MNNKTAPDFSNATKNTLGFRACAGLTYALNAAAIFMGIATLGFGYQTYEALTGTSTD